jgi:hypothetical protein
MKSFKMMTACAALAVAMTAAACGRDETPTAEQATTPQAGAPATDAARTAATGELTVAEVVSNADRYVGQEVTIVGEVNEVLSAMSFNLDEEAPLAAGVDNDLLVLYPKSANLEDLDDQWLNDKVRVRGTVGRMSVVEIEREVGWDLDPKIEAELEDQRPVIIARSVERVQ